MKPILQMIVNGIKPFLPLGADQAHKAVERMATIPKNDRMKFYGGMSAEEVAEAEVMYPKIADAVSDWTVFVASRGAIPADE